MTTQRPSPVSDNTEEQREFLQSRVALFWKVIFFIVLLSSAFGVIGAVAKPGVHLLLTFASTAHAGIFWWLSQRGERSIAFSQWMESGGLLSNAALNSVLGRYLLLGFAGDHAIVSDDGAVMADGYVSMLQLGGMAMLMANPGKPWCCASTVTSELVSFTVFVGVSGYRVSQRAPSEK